MQVVLNVMKNSQDNFKEKGIVNPEITISTQYNDGKTILMMCDNGGGIPEDVLPKIFDPYFSTKDEKNGTGLGLYMSKTIIQTHHNGDFWAENKDEGICFFIQVHQK